MRIMLYAVVGILTGVFALIYLVWVGIIPRDSPGFMLGYFAVCGGVSVALFWYNVAKTKQGNEHKCILGSITWSVGNTVPIAIFYKILRSLKKVPANQDYATIKNQIEEYLKKIGKKELATPQEQTEANNPKPMSDNPGKDEETIYIYVLPLEKPMLGEDEQTQELRRFQNAFIYCPGAPQSKHLPHGEFSQSVPYDGTVIEHGDIVNVDFDCLGWSEDPVTGEWIPHLLIVNSPYFAVSRRQRFSIPDLSQFHMVSAQIKDFGEKMLGLYTELQLTEEKLDDLLENRTKKIRELIDKERNTTNELEKRVFEPYEEQKPNYKKWILYAVLATVIMFAVGKLVGVW